MFLLGNTSVIHQLVRKLASSSRDQVKFIKSAKHSFILQLGPADKHDTWRALHPRHGQVSGSLLSCTK